MQEEVLSNLRACISSRKGGVSLNELNADYKELIGENVPYSKLGFRSLEEFVCTVPELSVDYTGTVTAIPTTKNKHLLELISKQKDKVKRHNNVFKPYKRQRTNSRQSYEAPRRNYRSSGYVQPPYYQNHQAFNYTNYNHAPPHFDYGQPHWSFQGYGQNRNYYSQNYQPYQHVQKYNSHPCKRPTDPNNNSTHTDLRHRINARKHKNRYVFVKEKNCVKSQAKECDWELKLAKPFSLDQCMWSKPAYIYDHQVIGDDLILETLGFGPRMLCDSGMTAKRALLGVREYGCSDRVIIAVGSVDILMGAAGEELVLDMQQLIQSLQGRGASVCVCTVPPIPSIGGHRPAIDAIISFNRWVRSANHGAQVIELHALFKDGPFVNHGMFQVLPKYTHGCMWPLRPWNSFAQAAVLDQLEWDLTTTNW